MMKRLRRSEAIVLSQSRFLELEGFRVNFCAGTLTLEVADLKEDGATVAKRRNPEHVIALMDRFCEEIAAGRLNGDTCQERFLRFIQRFRLLDIKPGDTVEDKPARRLPPVVIP